MDYNKLNDIHNNIPAYHIAPNEMRQGTLLGRQIAMEIYDGITDTCAQQLLHSTYDKDTDCVDIACDAHADRFDIAEAYDNPNFAGSAVFGKNKRFVDPTPVSEPTITPPIEPAVIPPVEPPK